MMIRLPPSPVSVPSIEVAMRFPRLRGRDLSVGLAFHAHGREGGLIDWIVDKRRKSLAWLRARKSEYDTTTTRSHG